MRRWVQHGGRHVEAELLYVCPFCCATTGDPCRTSGGNAMPWRRGSLRYHGLRSIKAGTKTRARWPEHTKKRKAKRLATLRERKT